MALWNGVSQVANVAQLAGVDANGLIKMIVEAVQTVRRNNETCQKLVRRIEMISDLLQQLQDAQLMQHRDTRRPMEQLEETLQRAYMLITSCRDSSFMYHCFTGANKAEQFRELENDVAFYLQLFSLVGYVDTTRTWVRNLNGGQPSDMEESVVDTQIMNNLSGHLPSALGYIRHEDTAEAVESRLQGVVKHSTGKKEQITRNNIFNELRKRNLKGQYLMNKNLVKLFCVERRRPGLLFFTHSQIIDFTENFKQENLVGCGAFGYVYKGKLPDGMEIAVKRHEATSNQGFQEFTAEIEMISNLQHKSVVRLLGFCIQRQKYFLGFHIRREEMIVVYEYMANKSLASFLHNYTMAGETVALSWSKCVHIIVGIAQGLVYLHEHSHQCVVHMDLKASNILLDNEMNPKISDFGMARILASSGSEETSDIVRGTDGYIDPEYARSGKFSVKTDVYSFGILMLEIVSGKRCRHFLPNGDMMDLPTCARELWNAGKPHELLDSSPNNEHQIAQITRCVHIALLCIQDCPADRPTMSDVLLMLRSESISCPMPKLPVNLPSEYPDGS